jgi:hypothetical protein
MVCTDRRALLGWMGPIDEEPGSTVGPTMEVWDAPGSPRDGVSIDEPEGSAPMSIAGGGVSVPCLVGIGGMPPLRSEEVIGALCRKRQERRRG